MILYKAQVASMVSSDGILTSNVFNVTVNPATAASLSLSAASATQTAGTTNQLTITAYDAYGNVATGYTGDKDLTFSGASTIGIYQPTVTDKTGAAVGLGTSEILTFTNGISSAGGLMTLYKVENASIIVNDGVLTSNALSIVVNSAAPFRLILTVASVTPTAGVADQVLITAYDLYGNLATAYTGNKDITFSGANSIGGYHPTVTDEAGNAINFGTTETLQFTSGVAAAGFMTLYKAESTFITASIGNVITNALAVTVNPAVAVSLTLSANEDDLTKGLSTQLSITAYDLYGNVATGYTGDKTFTFSEDTINSNILPNVTDKTGTPINFGVSETLRFSNGTLSAGGVLTLYNIGQDAITATDSTFTTNTIMVNYFLNLNQYFVETAEPFTNELNPPMNVDGYYEPVQFKQEASLTVNQVISDFISLYNQGKYDAALALVNEAFSEFDQKDLSQIIPDCSDYIVNMLYEKGELRKAIIARKRSLPYYSFDHLPKRIIQLRDLQEKYKKRVGVRRYLEDIEVSSNHWENEPKELERLLNMPFNSKILKNQLTALKLMPVVKIDLPVKYLPLI